LVKPKCSRTPCRDLIIALLLKLSCLALNSLTPSILRRCQHRAAIRNRSICPKLAVLAQTAPI
jgi:hypothetical protein